MRLNSFIFFLFFAFISVCCFAQQPPCYLPTDGLVAWYPFNGNANDSSGNGNNGTINGVSLTTDRYGNSNKAFYFDGNNKYISCPNDPQLLTSKSFTISAWFYLESRASSWEQNIIVSNLGVSGTGAGIQLTMPNPPGVYSGMFRNSSNVDVISNGSITIQQGQWYNYTFVAQYNISSNTTNTFNYINGILDNTANLPGSVSYQNVSPFYIGTNSDGLIGFQRAFKGKIDDVGIWNRSLTSQEALQIYRGSSPTPTIITSGPTTFCSGGNVVLSANNALQFNGNNQCMVANSNPTFNDNFTIEFWANPTTTIALGAQSTSGNQGGSGQHYALHPKYGGEGNGNTDAGAGISIGTNGIGIYEHGSNYLPALLVWSGNLTGWNHITVVYTNKQPSLYINGTPVATGLISPKTHVYPSLGNVSEGIGGGLYGYLNGQLDEFRLWKVSRSPAQIVASYNTSVNIPDTNLFVYYKLNEGIGTTAFDTSGNNNDAIFINNPVRIPSAAVIDYDSYLWTPGGVTTPSITATASGSYSFVGINNNCTSAPSSSINITVNNNCHVNNALHFDGVDDYVSFSNSFPFHNPGDVTLEFWMRFTATSERSLFWTRSDATDANRYNFFIESNGSLGIDYREPGGALHGLVYSSPIPSDTWTHITLTRVANLYSLYVNGILNTTGTDPNPNLPTAVGWRIADRISGFRYSGFLDEVRFWNYARSQTEIQSGMNCEISAQQTGLIGNYHFNQGIAAGNNTSPAINTLIDSSGNNNTGTLNNFTLNGQTSNWVTSTNLISTSSCLFTYYRDADQDGYGNPLIDSIATVQPNGYVLNNTDCNDNSSSIYPGATEICGNGIDEDCNGSDAVCGTALNFDGSNDYVISNNNVGIVGNASRTLEFWAKSNNPSAYSHLANWGITGSDNQAFGFWMFGGQLFFYGWNSGDFNTGINIDNNWHHFAVTFDGTIVKTYVDGNPTPVTNQPRILNTPASKLVIGDRTDALHAPFNGTFDELRIWNFARSQTQIQSSMNCEITIPQPGLVANYHFNQGIAAGNNTSAAINTLTDASGNNNTGTLNNFTLSGATSNWVTSTNLISASSCLFTYYRDADQDNYGNPLIDTVAVSTPTGYVLDNTDCNDSNPNIHPGAIEICGDGIDNNCDGFIDNLSGTPVVTGNTNVCIGTTLSLTAGGGDTYEWSGPGNFTSSSASISRPINNLDYSGNYIVIIGYNGCSQTTIITKHVNVLVPPSAAITGLNNSYCIGDPVSILTGIPSGGIFSGTGISGNTFTPNFLGTANIKYISPAYYGCSTDTIVLQTIVYDLPSLSINNSGGTILCPGDTLTLTANSNANNFLWNNGSTVNNISVTNPGTFTVIVTNTTGCKKSSTPVIISNEPVPDIISSLGTSICSGDNVQLSFNANTVTWNPGGVGSSIMVSPIINTLYRVNGTSVNNCYYKDSINIIVNPSATPFPVTNMLPPDGSTGLTLPVTLSWLPGIYNTRYTLKIWQASQPESSAIVIPTYNISETIGSLNLNTQYKWLVVSHNGNCKDSIGPVQTFTLRSLPDLVVQNIDIPLTAVGSQDISVGWQIKNIGAGGTGTASWIDKVYLSANNSLEPQTDQLLASHLNFSALNPGQAYNDSAVIHIPLNFAGTFYIIIETDAGLFLAESSEANNISISNPFIINIPPLPDLQVVSVSPQTNVFSGDTINITYTIKNLGNAIANHIIKDNIYVTGSAQLVNITGLQTAGIISDTVILIPGVSKTIQAKAIVPPHIAGTFFVHVYTDATNVVYEGPFETNNSRGSEINVFLSPPPDLTVHNLEMADTLIAGDIAVVKYSLKNIGFAKTDSTWYDGVFLSRDSIFSPVSAVPLRYIYHSNLAFASSNTVITLLQSGLLWSNNFGLNAGDSLRYSFAAPVPDTLAGKYHVFVVADVFNTVFEYNKEGNNILRRGNPNSLVTIAKQPVTILAPDLEVINITAPANASAGLSFTISWEVRNNGPGRLLNKPRRDAVYLSASANFDPFTAIFQGDVLYANPLASGQSIQLQKQVTLPVNTSGPKYIFIYTDYQNVIFENNIESNNLNSRAVLVSITNWPDLAGGTFNINDTLPTTFYFNFINEVQNSGNLPVNGSWTDNLYISRTATWNPDSSTLLKSFVHNNKNVPAGGAYSNNEPIRLPLSTEIINGQDSSFYYFYYRADVYNQVFENTGENNNLFWSSPVFVYNVLADHIVSSVSGNDTAIVGSPYNIQWNVKNIGNKPGSDYYNAWNDAVYLSADTVFSTPNTLAITKQVNNPLDHNASYNRNVLFTAPHGYAGTYYVFVYSDVNNNINGELNKNNNYNLIRDNNGVPKPIHFIELPAPDLVATSLTAPASGIAGQPLNFRYSVRNNGQGNALRSWADQLSLSPGYFATQNILINKNHAGGLAKDSSYSDSAMVFLPANANGNYVLAFRSDVLDNIYEAGAETNNSAYSPITIVQLPPCDLLVTGIIAPDSALSGTSAFISWKLKNTGINPAYGYTREAIYLSKDALLDNNDPLVGTVSNTVNLPSDSSVTHSITANLNGALAGYNYVLVRADLLNNIIESNENNNVTASIDSLFIYMKQLPIEVLVTDTLSNNSLSYYEIHIPDSLKNATLLVSCLGDTVLGKTELYLSFGHIPSLTSYDFAANNPYQKKKEIIIPSLDTGVYFLAVRGTVTNSNVQNIELLAHILPFAISSVETNHGGNSGNVTVKISGSKFEPGMTAQLLSTGLPGNITATNIIYVNSTMLWATFNLNQKPLGLYHVKLKKTNNDTTRLDYGFTIETGYSGIFTGTGNTGMTGTASAPGCDPGMEAGTGEGLLFTINAPERERTGRNIPITIVFANTGNVDIPVQVRLLTSEVFPISMVPYFPNYNQKDLTIEFSEPGGPPGILRAGASGGITFYTRVTLPVLNHFTLK